LARIALGLGGLTGTVDNLQAWSHATEYLVPVLSLFAVVTTTFGNLAAYSQTNLKRLLAYSTIAHAGFMMMGLATMTREGAGAVLFYLITYLFMNLGAFTVVAFMRNLTGHEDLSYFRGFVYRSPLLVITLAIFLLSLLGMPPLAGFAAKFQIFQVLFDAAQEYARRDKPGLSYILYGVLIAGALNTVISLFYYVKVLKVMVLEKTLEEVENRPVTLYPIPVLQSTYVSILAVVVLLLGIFWNPLSEASASRGINNFRSIPAARPVAQLNQGGN
jgi:NADH-quinone oxidoreductase subunit N